MILLIDDEKDRVNRWREELDKIDKLHYEHSAAGALAYFDDAELMAQIQIVVLDLALYTSGGLSEKETDFGRLTGEVLRQRLRKSGWPGKIVVLSNSADQAIRAKIESDGDRFFRKPETLPSQLSQEIVKLMEGQVARA